MRRKTKHYRKERNKAGKIAVVIAAVAIVAVCSIIGAMANTVPFTVIDGKDTYSFDSMDSDVENVLEKAQQMGMPPVRERDKVLRKDEVITVYRAIDVSVNVDGELTNIVAYYGDTVAKALAANGITYPADALLTPVGNEVITSDLAVFVETGRKVTITADGATLLQNLQGTTVSEVLESAGIELKAGDKVVPSLDSGVTSGMKIRVIRACKITVLDGGDARTVMVAAETVQEALDAAGFKLAEEDRVSPALTEAVKDGDEITITRVEYEESEETEEIPYETVYQETDELKPGQTEIVTEGVPGEKTVLYHILYEDGEIVEKKAVSETVIREPVARVVRRGVEKDSDNVDGENNSQLPEDPDLESVVDCNGDPFFYDYVLSGNGKGTAYCLPGNVTSLGWPVREGIVAVDPNLIPYESELYIIAQNIYDPDDYIFYYGVAADTGGALLCGDALVDVYYDTLEKCSVFGRRNVTVYVRLKK